LRKVFRKVPGGRVSIHYKIKMPKHSRCGNCGATLKGTPRVPSYRLKNMTKSKKRPERPYGGVLCSGCMRRMFIEKARV
jgi:large subunit ribosomal protein L34e